MLSGEGKVAHMSLGNKECDYNKKSLRHSYNVSKDHFDDFKYRVHIVYLGQIISVLNRLNLSLEGLCLIIHSTAMY